MLATPNANNPAMNKSHQRGVGPTPSIRSHAPSQGPAPRVRWFAALQGRQLRGVVYLLAVGLVVAAGGGRGALVAVSRR